MKRVILVFVATVMLCWLTVSQAQVRKCVGAGGKVTYSDALCASTTDASTTVKTNVNHLDNSRAREQVAKSDASRQENESESRGADRRQVNAPECKFPYAVISERAKALSENAKLECLRNIEAKRLGKPVSMEAYALWKDDREMRTERLKAIPRTVNCNRNGIGGVVCN